MSPFVKLTAIPDGLSDVDKGATPLWMGMDTMEPYFKKDIYKVLFEEMKNPIFTHHEAGRWECFERAFWGISVVRCKCPGAPVGIAYGTALEGPAAIQADPRHAVIYYWHMINGKHTLAMFDPIAKATLGDISRFDLKAFVGFPIFRPNYKIDGISIGKSELMPQFNAAIGKGNIMIYNNFEQDPGYDVKNFEKIMADLKEKRFNSCPRPAAGKELQIYNSKRFREDRAFWIFNQMRSRYMRAAIGFAWGTKEKETNAISKDTAMLVVWSSPRNFVLWDVVDGKMIDDKDFKAEFVVG